MILARGEIRLITQPLRGKIEWRGKGLDPSTAPHQSEPEKEARHHG